MIVNMNAAPVEAFPKTSARIARTIARNVDATAASCGELPKGALMKKDQLQRERLGGNAFSLLCEQMNWSGMHSPKQDMHY